MANKLARSIPSLIEEFENKTFYVSKAFVKKRHVEISIFTMNIGRYKFIQYKTDDFNRNGSKFNTN